MQHRTSPHLGTATALAVVALSAAGCSTGAPAAPVATPGTELALPSGAEPVTLDPAQFTADITHPYWPMTPGTRWTYSETDGKGGTQQIVMVVTTTTKKLANGITARVVRDTATEDGQIVEDTNDWFAQDRAGNLWYLGEDTAEFENGTISTREGSFEAGKDGALPGIALPADPKPGMSYRQEYLEGEAEDNGEVLSIDAAGEVPYGEFTGALLTRDTSTIEPGLQEYKFYVKGVGPTLVLSSSLAGGRQQLLTVDTAPAGAGTGPLGRPNP